jgi:hypothetical protein
MATEANGEHTRGLVQRIALVAMVVIGAFLIVLPLATRLPSKSAATGDMMTAFRPQMTDAALAQGAADGQTMAAMGQQLNTGMIPALAQQMKMTPDQMSAYLGTNFPAVGKGMAEFNTILPFFGNLQATMQAQQANYQQADQIPTGFLPPTSMTWLFVLPGAAFVLLGLFGLARPRLGRAMIAGAGVVGIVLVVGLLAVSMYGKASSADTMTTAFSPVFATQNVQQARADTNTVEAMSAQFTQQALPGLATALHMTPTQMSAMLTQQFPAVATGVAQLPQIVQRMETATSLIEGNVDNYNQSAAIPWSPGSMVAMFWLMMAPAVLAVVLAAGALLATAGHPTVRHAAVPRPRAGALHG